MNAGLPVLTFHSLDDSGAVTSTSPDRFARIVGRLVDAGFVGVDLPDWIDRGRPAVEKGFAVTFDDGYRSILRGMAVLERHRIPSTVFLVTDHVGGLNDWPGQPMEIPRAPLLDWSEVADLSRRGVSFGAHTATHPALASGEEIRRSRDAIESSLGRACRLFAYPYGHAPMALRYRVATGFDAAFGARLDLATIDQDRFALSRIDAYYLRSPSVVERLISRRLGPWLTIRRGLRACRRLAVERPKSEIMTGKSWGGVSSPLPPGEGARRAVEGSGHHQPAPTGDSTSIEPAIRPGSDRSGHPALTRPSGTLSRGEDLVCPACRAPVDRDACPACQRVYPTVAGLPDFRLESDRYLTLDAERAKAGRLARIAATTDLEGVARAYYDITPDVDPPRCRRYLRHILGADRRGEALADRVGGDGPILEVGCGTGGLLVALARRGISVEGVDIAARWLVVARRRLDDAGLNVPLLAANADRLPYPDGSFATVVADSLIEHCNDPAAALGEWRRVLRPGGRLILWSPNRTSLTTDPHVRLWGLGFLPRRWAVGYVGVRRGGAWLPRTQTIRGAARLVASAGFERIEAGPPDLGSLRAGRLGAIYEVLRRFGPTRVALGLFGPLWSIEARAPR